MSHTGFEDESDVQRVIADALRRVHPPLDVRVHPRIRDIQPDLLIETPHERFVIEVKAGSSSSRLSSVVQLARFAELLAREPGSKVTPILVAVGRDATDLKEAANDFGVEVIAGEDLEFVAASVHARFSELPAHGTPQAGETDAPA
jgi:RecB family endonuclease NucS